MMLQVVWVRPWDVVRGVHLGATRRRRIGHDEADGHDKAHDEAEGGRGDHGALNMRAQNR